MAAIGEMPDKSRYKITVDKRHLLSSKHAFRWQKAMSERLYLAINTHSHQQINGLHWSDPIANMISQKGSAV